jgi:hypothetical protein
MQFLIHLDVNNLKFENVIYFTVICLTDRRELQNRTVYETLPVGLGANLTRTS